MAHQTFWLLLAVVIGVAAVFFLARARALMRRRRREQTSEAIENDVAEGENTRLSRPAEHDGGR